MQDSADSGLGGGQYGTNTVAMLADDTLASSAGMSDKISASGSSVTHRRLGSGGDIFASQEIAKFEGDEIISESVSGRADRLVSERTPLMAGVGQLLSSCDRRPV